MFVRNGAVLEARSWTSGYGHHAEVGIIYARPLHLTIDRVTIGRFCNRRFQTEPFEQRTEHTIVAAIGMDLQRVDAAHGAVNHRDTFRRVEIKAVVIDALIADVWPDHYLCVRHRLIVAREF